MTLRIFFAVSAVLLVLTGPSSRAGTTKDLTVTLADRTLQVAATAEFLPITNGKGDTTAEIFVTSYVAKDAPAAQRPVTFLFNGGPGAASAFLHLGAVGPRVLVTNADGTLPPPPVRLEDNPASWIAFTDLVFVDPVGTGYSRASGKDEDADKSFWGVRADVRTSSEVVRLWLTRNGRWSTPKYLAGESYGGFRIAMMARNLQRDAGVEINGLIMVSPALEFSLIFGGDYDLLSWATRLPTLVASSHAWGLGARGSSEAGAMTQADIERFALNDYLVGLANGGGEDQAFIERVAGLLGLPAAVVARQHGRVPAEIFAKELLHERGRVLSIYDGTVAGPDPDPERQTAGPDPLLDAVIAPYSSAFNAYVRGELGFETDAPFRLLNRRVSGEWDWDAGRDGSQGYVGVMDTLQDALALNPAMRVLVVHGIHDMVTPYLASRWLVDRLRLLPEVRANVRTIEYEGGHMMYMRPTERTRLAHDVRHLYEGNEDR
jgi:carboxypeptidase C (cathepsin A)